MKTSIKWGLMTLLVVGGGLLLGGNAIADSNQGDVAKVAVVSTSEEKVKLYEEQAKSLTEQVQAYLSDRREAQIKSSKEAELSQKQLDAIEVEVKKVAKKTAELKEDVEKFVLIRAINNQIAGLKVQVAELKLAEQAEGTSGATVTQTETKTETKTVTTTQTGSGTETGVAAVQPEGTQAPENVSAQIAMIKQQIKDLTAEYEVQKAAEEAQNSEPVSTQEIECEGGVCSASIDVNPAGETATTETATNKGFWQNVSDFLKNLFTF
jgi:hypothetical protein